MSHFIYLLNFIYLNVPLKENFLVINYSLATVVIVFIEDAIENVLGLRCSLLN